MEFIRNKKRTFIIATIVLLVITLPLVLFLAQKQQDIRQRAATSPQVCTADQPTDTMIIFDRSGSMTSPTSKTDTTSRLVSAKNAANAFVTILQKRTESPLHQASLTVFSSVSLTTTSQSQTADMTKLHTSINAITAYGDTCVECGIRTAAANLLAHDRNGVKNVAVLLTDGGATEYIGIAKAATDTAGKALSAKKALEAAQEVSKKQNVTFYTIGFGDSLNDQLLKDIATSSGGMYYFAPTGTALTTIYQQIAQDIGKGVISGNVFDDASGNGQRETTESGLANWTVQLTNASTHATIATTTTDASGHYTFTGDCDGAYEVKLTLKPGWTQTTPPNNATQSVIISHGNTVTDRNFGVNLTPTPTPTKPAPTPTFTPTPTLTPTPSPTMTPIPTPTPLPPTATPTPRPTATPTPRPTATPVPPSPTSTPTPNDLKVTIALLLHGIGASGDSANPNPVPCQTVPRNPATCLSNQNPLRGTRSVNLQILDQSGTEVMMKSGSVTYNTANGDFEGSVDLGDIPAGSYNMKVWSTNYLHQSLPGIKVITANQTQLQLPATTLVTGDTNNDNTLNILDYNLIADCYSDFLPAVACDPAKKVLADLTDDGSVNQSDLNLFLRDFSVQHGD
jgi:hypothetical protein